MIDFIDTYCERTAPGLWSEPLNAVTNLGFILAAVMALRLWRRQPHLTWRNSWDLLLLITLLFAIGIGSGLWHTFASPWAMSADTLPILLFINVYLLSFLVRLAGLRWLGTFAFFMLFHLANRAMAMLFTRDFLNGSIFYGPAWATLLILASVLAARRHRAARGVAIAAAVFTVSLAFRTIDKMICPVFPLGTHLLWHACNAAVLYLLVAALIRGATPRGRASAPF